MARKNYERNLVIWSLVAGLVLLFLVAGIGDFKFPFAIGGSTALSIDNVVIDGNNRIRIFMVAEGAEDLDVILNEDKLDSFLKPKGYDATQPIQFKLRLEKQTVSFPITKQTDRQFYNLNLLNRGTFAINSVEKCQTELNNIRSGLIAVGSIRAGSGFKIPVVCIYKESLGNQGVFSGAEINDYEVSVSLNGEMATLSRKGSDGEISSSNVITLANGRAKVEGVAAFSGFDRISAPSSYSLLFQNSQYTDFIPSDAYASEEAAANRFQDCIGVGRQSPSNFKFGFIDSRKTVSEITNCVAEYRQKINQVTLSRTSEYKNSIAAFAKEDSIRFIGDSLVVDLDRPNVKPSFVIDLDAAWVGIKELKGEPEIVQCAEGRTFNSGDTQTRTLRVRNKASSDGSFSGTV